MGGERDRRDRNHFAQPERASMFGAGCDFRVVSWGSGGVRMRRGGAVAGGTDEKKQALFIPGQQQRKNTLTSKARR